VQRLITDSSVVLAVTESLQYTVENHIGNVEIRRYPTIVLATVSGLSDNAAFRVLFRYITGNNRTRTDVAMTVPVISNGPTSEELAMTRPVVSDDTTFSFAMPSLYSISTIPEPLDDRVKMVEIKSRRMAVLRFSGRAGTESAKKREEELLQTLKENGIRIKGTPVLMRYNGPGTPGFLRHNEVAVEIEDLAPIEK